jgi:hypothetical protein
MKVLKYLILVTLLVLALCSSSVLTHHAKQHSAMDSEMEEMPADMPGGPGDMASGPG